MSKNTESKTVKDALKEAREHIDKKDHKSALKCCKRALNVDKNNYMALVFCGICFAELGQHDQALQAYKKATETCPDQLTAWQGLAAFYEKQKEPKKEDMEHLAKVYEKILEFFKAANDLIKYYATSDKLVTLYSTKLLLIDQAVTALQDRAQFSKEANKEDKIYYANAEIVKLLSQTQNITDEQSQLLKATLSNIISDSSSSIQNSENMKTMIRLLYKLRDMEELLEVALKMTKIFPESSYALEWICKVYLEYVTDSLDFKNKELEESIENHVEKLLSLSPTSTLAKLAKASISWKIKKDFGEASKMLGDILDIGKSTNPNFYALYILCQCYVQLRNLSEAEKSLKLALILLPDKVKEESTRAKLNLELTAMLANTLFEQGKFDKVLEVVNDDNAELKALLIKTYANIGQRSKVNDLSQQVDVDVSLIAQAILLKTEGNLSEAVKVLDGIKEASFEAILLKAQIDWQCGNFDQAHASFLLAAKSNPHSWVPFYYLGEFYRKPGGKHDLDRARKCYQKSFALNPHAIDAGSALSDILRTQGKSAENLAFLTSVTSSDQGSAQWAHLRLGMHFLSVDEPSKAIMSLQNVLRSDPDNFIAWESLADSYFNRGSYTSALKAYEKVLALAKSRNCHYANLQIATIKLKLGFFREAKLALREILKEDPHYVPALKVMAECLLQEGREFLHLCIDKNVVDNCQEAINALVTAIQETQRSSTHFSCIWKLLGEALLLMNALPMEIAILRVPSILLLERREEKEEINKLQALQLASKAFIRALNIDPDNVSSWQDLALSFHFRCQEKDNSDPNLRANALNAIKKGLALSPQNHELWNVLGVMSVFQEDFALAQHAFIRSLSIRSNSMAWSNLGLLYFTQGRADLANKAFQESQNQDPTYLQGWIGQALLAEAAGYEEEAIDLFRHCTFIGNGVESSIGYGNWICKTLQEMSSNDQEEMVYEKKKHNRYCVENMFGVTVAVDCLYHYVERIQDDPCAFNMLGILLEREGHFRSAKKMLTKSLRLLNNETLCDQVLHNLARVLYKLGEYEGSIKCYKKITKQSFYSQVGLALSNMKAGKFQDSYAAYGAALQLNDNPELRSHVLAAMATIAYKFQGGDAAKTLLFQSCQQRPPSLQAILALCVLGLKQSDPMLVKAAMLEMDKTGLAMDNEDIVSMKALLMAVQGNGLGARRLISKAIHRSPSKAGLWKVMAIHLLNYHSSTLSGSASRCAQKSIQNSASLETMSLVGLCLLNVDKKLASKEAIKAIHCYPQNLEPWSVLLAACPAEAKIKRMVKAVACTSDNKSLIEWVHTMVE